MNNKMLVSIVLPVYNVEKYIGKCIETIVNQTYKDIEIIVVDDGTPDHSIEIVNEFDDSRILVIHQENGGLSAARNFGLKYCHGDAVIFIDSDDYLALNMIEKLVEAMEQTGADLVNCQYFFDEEGKITKHLGKNEFSSRCISSLEAIELDIERDELQACVWTKLCKREILWDDMYPAGLNFEDNYTINRLLSRCNKIYMLNEYLYYYRIRNEGIVRNINEKRISDQFESCTYFYNEIKDQYPQFLNKAKKLYINKVYTCYFHVRYHRIQNKELENTIKKTLKSFRFDKEVEKLYTYPELRYCIGRIVEKIKR